MFLLPKDPKGLKEKVAKGRMRGIAVPCKSTLPPHPGPLPQGEGIAQHALREIGSTQALKCLKVVPDPAIASNGHEPDQRRFNADWSRRELCGRSCTCLCDFLRKPKHCSFAERDFSRCGVNPEFGVSCYKIWHPLVIIAKKYKRFSTPDYEAIYFHDLSSAYFPNIVSKARKGKIRLPFFKL